MESLRPGSATNSSRTAFGHNKLMNNNQTTDQHSFSERKLLMQIKPYYLIALVVAISSCNNSTSPSDNSSFIIGSWRNINKDTILYQVNTDGSKGAPITETDTTISTFSANGNFQNVINSEIASYKIKDSTYGYSGTWTAKNDTLYIQITSDSTNALLVFGSSLKFHYSISKDTLILQTNPPSKLIKIQL